MTSPICQVKDGAGSYQSTTTGCVSVTASNTITIQLADTTGVSTWSIQCVGADETTSATSVTSSLVVDSVAKTATFTAGSAGKAYLFRSTINGGLLNGQTYAGYVQQFKVAVPASNGLIVGTLGETTEHDPSNGWLGVINPAVRNSGAGGGGFTAGGDLTGTSTSQTVAKINGATVPAAGALTAGNIAQVSGSAAITYGPLNLAGGSNTVTGSLPAANQAAQTLGGQLSGTTASAAIAIASQAQGDILYFNGTSWVRLAAGTSGYVLQTGGTGANPSWVASTSGTSLELTSSGGVTCTAGTGAGSVDTLVYTVPASPTGNGRLILTGLTLRLGTALVGTGSVAMTAGTTAGGTDLLTSQSITSSTTAGTVYGLTLSTLGTAFVSTDGYNATLAAGATIYVRLTSSGTITTAPILSAHAYGMAQ